MVALWRSDVKGPRWGELRLSEERPAVKRWAPPRGTEALSDEVCRRVLTKFEFEAWVLFRDANNISAVARASGRTRQAVHKSLVAAGRKLEAVLFQELEVPEVPDERLPLRADDIPERITNEWMLEAWQRVGAAALAQITPENLRFATPKDLAAIADRATEKVQLLKGLPTQRVAHEDRRKLDELVVMLMEEVKRRGIEIDVTPTGDVEVKSLAAAG